MMGNCECPEPDNRSVLTHNFAVVDRSACHKVPHWDARLSEPQLHGARPILTATMEYQARGSDWTSMGQHGLTALSAAAPFCMLRARSGCLRDR